MRSENNVPVKLVCIQTLVFASEAKPPSSSLSYTPRRILLHDILMKTSACDGLTVDRSQTRMMADFYMYPTCLGFYIYPKCLGLRHRCGPHLKVRTEPVLQPTQHQFQRWLSMLEDRAGLAVPVQHMVLVKDTTHSCLQVKRVPQCAAGEPSAADGFHLLLQTGSPADCCGE